jgi:hypothetical protein
MQLPNVNMCARNIRFPHSNRSLTAPICHASHPCASPCAKAQNLTWSVFFTIFQGGYPNSVSIPASLSWFQIYVSPTPNTNNAGGPLLVTCHSSQLFFTESVVLWWHFIQILSIKPPLILENECRSQWPRGLRHELTSPAQTLGSWVRIPLQAWMSVCVYVLVLSCACR